MNTRELLQSIWAWLRGLLRREPTWRGPAVSAFITDALLYRDDGKVKSIARRLRRSGWNSLQAMVIFDEDTGTERSYIGPGTDSEMRLSSLIKRNVAIYHAHQIPVVPIFWSEYTVDRRDWRRAPGVAADGPHGPANTQRIVRCICEWLTRWPRTQQIQIALEPYDAEDIPWILGIARAIRKTRWRGEIIVAGVGKAANQIVAQTRDIHEVNGLVAIEAQTCEGVLGNLRNDYCHGDGCLNLRAYGVRRYQRDLRQRKHGGSGWARENVDGTVEDWFLD